MTHSPENLWLLLYTTKIWNPLQIPRFQDLDLKKWKNNNPPRKTQFLWSCEPEVERRWGKNWIAYVKLWSLNGKVIFKYVFHMVSWKISIWLWIFDLFLFVFPSFLVFLQALCLLSSGLFPLVFLQALYLLFSRLFPLCFSTKYVPKIGREKFAKWILVLWNWISEIW